MLCEGGPHLNGALLAAGVVDELFLTLAPKLGGGADPQASLRIVCGPELDSAGRAGAARGAGERRVSAAALRGLAVGLTRPPRRARAWRLVRRHPRSSSRRPASVWTATFSTTLLGTSTEPSSVANVVYISPSELTTPSIWPASGPPCRRTRSPTRNGPALSSTVPAIRLPSVCCAARPRTTAVNAPPTASVRGSTPAISSATSSATPTVTRRITKPTVPAVAGSMRRKSAGRSAGRRRARSPSRGSAARPRWRSARRCRLPASLPCCAE